MVSSEEISRRLAAKRTGKVLKDYESTSETLLYCSKCQTFNPREAHYCQGCGSSFVKDESINTNNELVEDLQKRVSRLENANESLNREKNQLADDVQMKITLIQNLGDRIRDLENKSNNNSPNFEVSRLTKENTSLKNETRRLKSEINNLKIQIKKMPRQKIPDQSALINEYKSKINELHRKNHKLNELLQPFESTLKGLTRKELYLAEIKRIRDNPDPRMATKLDVVIRDIVREAPLNVTKLNSAYEKPFYKNAFYDYLKEHASRCSDEADKREFLEREYKMLRQAYDPATYPTTLDLRRSRTWATERIFDLDDSKRRIFEEI